MLNPVMEVKNLSVVYKNIVPMKEDFQALKDVSFTLESGKIYGLIGRNGAGKTSLLSVLASFRKPTKGEVLINGQPLFDDGNLMKDIQFVYQKEFSTDMGEIYPKILKYIKKETMYRPNFDLSYAKELIEKFGLPLNKRPNKLSKGMQSMLAVVIGLASRAPITIFDEAYLGMDAPTRDLFYKEVIKDQERHPRTMVMSTHLVSEMEYLFDEVIIIHKGELLQVGPYDHIVAAGSAIGGLAEGVDAFAKGRHVLHTEMLGGYKKVTLAEELTDQDQLLAQELNLEMSTISLQDLFIHLTKGEGADV